MHEFLPSEIPPVRPFLRHPIGALCVLILLASCARVPSRFTRAQPRDLLYSEMVGRWHGSMAIGRVGTSVSRVLPAALTVVPAPDRDGLELQYRFGSGPGMVARAMSHWHFERGLTEAQWGGALDVEAQSYTVVERSGGRNGEPMRLVLEGDGFDGDQPARIRQTLELSTGSLQVRKDVKHDGGDYTFRHTLSYTRAE